MKAVPSVHYPVIVISDTHLGMRHKSAGLLGEFLRHVRCDRLIMAGDIVDGHRLDARRARSLPEDQARVLDVLNRKVSEGMEAVFVPGNHDGKLRRRGILGAAFMGIRFEKSLDLIDARGRRLLVTHGDRFDKGLVPHPSSRLMNNFFDYGYVAIARLSLAVDKISAVITGRPLRFSMRVRSALESFFGKRRGRQEAATRYARQRGYDGVICGHFHQAALHQKEGGVFYANSGDWVESFTALGMKEDGEWELIEWGRKRKELCLARVFEMSADNPDKDFRPQTEKMCAAIHALWPGRAG